MTFWKRPASFDPSYGKNVGVKADKTKSSEIPPSFQTPVAAAWQL